MALLLLASTAWAEEPAADGNTGDKGGKLISGMSIVGNDEAPKSLVIVPWKSSELGDTLDVSKALDDGRQPLDRDVFMRELAYWEIRAGLRKVPSSRSSESR
jgi:hypothetical protein